MSDDWRVWKFATLKSHMDIQTCLGPPFLYTVHIYNDDDYDCGPCSMKIGSQKLVGSDRSRNSPNKVSISANPSTGISIGAGSVSSAISGGETGPLLVRCLLAGTVSSCGATCTVSRAPVPRASGLDCVVCPWIWWSAFCPSLAMASAEYQYGLICSSSEQQASRLAFARSRCVMSLLERSCRYETPIESVIEYGTTGSGGRLSAHSDATIEWMRTAARPCLTDESLPSILSVGL